MSQYCADVRCFNFSPCTEHEKSDACCCQESAESALKKAKRATVQVFEAPEIKSEDLEEVPLELDPSMVELDATNMRLRSLAQVYRLEHLQELCVRQNNISDLTDLAKSACGLASLTHLDLYGNSLTVDTNLNLLTNLTTLDLSFNSLRSVVAIGSLTNLTSLYLCSNKIDRIQGVSNLTNLTMLEYGSNRIRTIEGVSTLTNLTELWLGKNKITQIEGLAELTKLERLSIQSNRLLTIGAGLASLVNLLELYLSHNGISEMRGLSTLTKLRLLDLSNNRITKLEGLEPLTALTELWLNNNHFADWEELKCVQAPAIETVYFERNPLQGTDLGAYRVKLLRLFPSLQQIDSAMVEDFRDELPTDVPA